MEATQTCVFCGAAAAARTMDMTGLGWRCTTCSVRSELAIAHGQGEDMATHLTRPELEAVVGSGKHEALGGGVLVVLGAGASLASALAGASIVLVFFGAIAAGMGMIFHGLHRRRRAISALGAMPTARVVRRKR